MFDISAGKLIGSASILAALVIGQQVCCSEEADDTTEEGITQTAVVVMVDVSKSFFPLSVESLGALKQAAADLRYKTIHDWEEPVSFFWSTIGDPAKVIYPCGPAIQYVPTPIPRIGRQAPSIKINQRELDAWHRDCIDGFSGRRSYEDDDPNKPIPIGTTSISAAINVAGTSMQTIRGKKVLVLLSDFEEALKGQAPFPFQLSGEYVVLLAGLNQSDNGDVQKAIERARRWEERLELAGASKVCIAPTRALQPDRVRQCFNKFDKKPEGMLSELRKTAKQLLRSLEK